MNGKKMNYVEFEQTIIALGNIAGDDTLLQSLISTYEPTDQELVILEKLWLLRTGEADMDVQVEAMDKTELVNFLDDMNVKLFTEFEWEDFVSQENAGYEVHETCAAYTDQFCFPRETDLMILEYIADEFFGEDDDTLKTGNCFIGLLEYIAEEYDPKHEGYVYKTMKYGHNKVMKDMHDIEYELELTIAQ